MYPSANKCILHKFISFCAMSLCWSMLGGCFLVQNGPSENFDPYFPLSKAEDRSSLDTFTEQENCQNGSFVGKKLDKKLIQKHMSEKIELTEDLGEGGKVYKYYTYYKQPSPHPNIKDFYIPLGTTYTLYTDKNNIITRCRWVQKAINDKRH